MKKYSKIIFTDIDSTIRERSGHIPESTIEAIHILQKNGCAVLVSTGRPECEIPERVIDIGLDGTISACGARVRFDGEVIYDREIPREQFLTLTDYMFSHDIVGYFQQAEFNAVIDSQYATYMEYDKRMHDLLPAGSERLCPVPRRVSGIEEVAHPQKLAFYGNTTPNETFMEEMPDGFDVVPLALPSVEKYTGEIMWHELSKGNAIRFLLDYLHFPKDETIGVGDSENDIPMLQATGTSIVLGNGSKPAKEAADIVTDPINQDGFYNAFERLGLL